MIVLPDAIAAIVCTKDATFITLSPTESATFATFQLNFPNFGIAPRNLAVNINTKHIDILFNSYKINFFSTNNICCPV